MNIAETIESKINDAIKPGVLRIENESHMHAGPASESHFKLIVVADEFNNLTRVRRHQRIYQLLAEEMAAGVHALAMHLYSPDEWSEVSEQAPDSPDCRGGG